MRLGPCEEFDGRIQDDGYGIKWFQGRHWYAHRLAWFLAKGPIPPGLCVLHHCDNRACRKIKHLYLGTHKDNARDREQRGRGRRLYGEQHGQARLTWVAVREIRRLYEEGEATQRGLAQRFGVSQRTVVKIIHRINWRE